MAAFEYRALTADGRRVSGVISSDTPRMARQVLRSRGLTPVAVHAARDKSAGAIMSVGRIRERDRTLLTRQLCVLIASGMTVEQALTAASGDNDNTPQRAILLGVREQVMEGASLAESMRLYPKAFPPLYRAVVASGESAGRLGPVLDQLANHLERSYKLRTMVRSALIYPMLLAVMAVLMVTALMVFVVPRLVEQFALLGASELPLLTRLVIGTSDFVRSQGLFLVIAFPLMLLILRTALRKPGWKHRADALILAMPFFGDMARKVAAARFARIHATMAGAGATVIESLSGARNAMGNLVFRAAADTIIETVKQGGTLSAAMKATGVFPDIMTHMVASGEAARDVPAMLNRAADFLEGEFETASEVALSLLEPVIILLLGGLVGTIVLSIMLPIMQLNTLALG